MRLTNPFTTIRTLRARIDALEAVNATTRIKRGAGGRALAAKRRAAVMARKAQLDQELGRMG